MYLLNCHGFLVLQSQLPEAQREALPLLHPVAKVLVSQLIERTDNQPQLQDMETGEEGR